MSSEKEAALDLLQQGLGILVGSNSWNVYGTPNLKTVRQMASNKCSCTTQRAFFSWVIEYQIFYF